MIGEVVNLPARWRGEYPMCGDYLCTGARARFAYRVIDVRPIAPRSRRARRFNVMLSCVREAPGDVPPFARVWRWKWVPRR